jgi:hypothetical protein
MKYKNEKHQLGIFEEAVGTLCEMARKDGFLIVEISGFNIVLPLDIEVELALLIGKRVGILRTDIPGKEYLIRIIPEAKSLASDELNMIGLPKLKA